MELKLLVADVLVLVGPVADAIIVVADTGGSEVIAPTVLVVMLLVVVIVDVVIADDDDGIDNDGDRNGEAATPTISEMSSEKMRDGENERVGLKLI